MPGRRNFLKTAAVASTGIALTGLRNTSTAAGYNRIKNAGRKINLACVGIGNRGADIISELYKTGLANIVALCDADLGATHTQKMLDAFPGAKRFKDFREMFDKMGNHVEAVCIGTPDHSHFPICMDALRRGKHVYVEKPMARTFLEAELLIKAAKKYNKVVTQVGNQGHSEANYFQFKAWKDAGIIKDVTAITAHMNAPRRWHNWDVNIKKFPAAEPVPDTLDWDEWLAAIPYHDYNKDFHMGQWRAWYDFGMGALGDWGAHILDTAHEFLQLQLPYEINPLKIEGHNDYFFPKASTILFRFAARGKMPPVDVTWYDGVDNIPEVPEGYGTSALDPNIPPAGNNTIQPAKLNPGKIIYSKTLTFKGGSHGSTLSIIPEEKAKAMASKLPRVPESTSNHFANFLLACSGQEKTRSPFEIHGPLSQVFSLGVIAQRVNKKLQFNTHTQQITNDAFANALLAGPVPRKGWEEFYKV